MKISSRGITVLLSVLLLAAFLVTPAAAARDPFRGVWVSIDIDGSSQRLVVGGGRAGTYRALFYDDGATVCGLDPDTGDILYAAVARGPFTLSGNTISADLPITCLSRPPGSIGVYTLTFTYDAASDTLTDGIGVVWYRR